MSTERDIAEIRKRLAGMGTMPGGETFPATVREVDGERRVCTVEAEGVIYDDVRLYAVNNAELKGFYLLPARQSAVLVSRIGGSNELYVAMFSEIDEVRITVGNSSLTMTADGFAVTRNDSGLRDTFEKLIDAICALTVTTGVGPSGTPINIADFKAIKNDLKNYLNG